MVSPATATSFHNFVQFSDIRMIETHSSSRYVVCEYYPPGNYDGQYQADVQSQVKCEQGAVCSAATTVRPTMFSTSLTGTSSPTATSGCAGWCALNALGLRGVWMVVGVGIWMSM